MRTGRPRRGEEALWEAMDEAFFGEGAAREDRARIFGAMMDVAVARAACRGGGATFGVRLRELRRERGLTPTRASRQAGLDAGLWRSWEASVRIPTLEDLGRVTGVLGASRWRELARLRRGAPEACLAQVLAGPSLARVARSAGPEAAAGDPEGLLEVRNLDALVRAGLEAWCREHRGGDSEEVLAAALEEARGLDPEAREAWIRTVGSRVELEP
jgi:transcriptional regulator with XRE-family HTH domain